MRYQVCASLMLCWLWVVFLCPSNVGLWANHPFHICVGQMQHNPQTGQWEVSLRMHPRDLELALTDLNRRNISREDKDFAEVVIDYLSNQFFLMSNTDSKDLKDIHEQISKLAPARSLEDKSNQINQRSKLEWVGMESERGWLWIHLELTPPEGPASQGPLVLVHRLFLDRIEAQENSVSILQTRTKRSSLQFKKGQAAKLFVVPS